MKVFLIIIGIVEGILALGVLVAIGAYLFKSPNEHKPQPSNQSEPRIDSN